MFGTENKSGYHTILGNKTDYDYQELEKSMKYSEEFQNYFEEYKQSNNYIIDFDEMESDQKVQFFILLFFIVNIIKYNFLGKKRERRINLQKYNV